VPDQVVDLEPGPAPTERASTTATALARKDAPPPSRLDSWSLARADAPKLGDPCPPPHENAPAAGVIQPCGAAGRVALEYEPYHQLVGEPPCEMRQLESERQMFETRGCVDGDHLVLSSVCMVCRSSSGWAAHARLSELTADQNKALYGRIGYGKDGQAPTSPGEWRALVSSAKPIEKPKPTAP